MKTYEQEQSLLRELVRGYFGLHDTEDVLKHVRPAALLTAAEQSSTPGARFGGQAMLTAEQEWPMRKNRPMALMVRLDLSELAEEVLGLQVPGWLNFFVDPQQPPSAFGETFRRWAVRYAPADAARPVDPPAAATRWPESAIELRTVPTLPSMADSSVRAFMVQHEEYESEVSDEFEWEWTELVGIPGRGPDKPGNHRVGGWPTPIQNCVWQEMGGFSDEYVLLLQLEWDKFREWKWDDGFALYLFISQRDLQQADFSRCRVVVQSR